MKSENTERPFTLIVGIDFGEQSEQALRVAANLAIRSRSSILHVVHCVPIMPSLDGVAPLYKDMEIQSRRNLEKLTEGLSGECVVEIHAEIGSAVSVLCEMATNLGADVIVVGTHGRKGVARLAFGSVAETLVKEAPCSVLVVRDRTPAPEEQIEPPCPACIQHARDTSGKDPWCDAHRHHPERVHAIPHYEGPTGADFGMGSMLIRPDN